MAKKKSELNFNEAENNSQSTENSILTASDEVTEEVVEESVDAVVEAKSEAKELPLDVVRYFQRHEDVEAIYMDRLGGAYDLETPAVFRKQATLYYNPNFKH